MTGFGCNHSIPSNKQSLQLEALYVSYSNCTLHRRHLITLQCASRKKDTSNYALHIDPDHSKLVLDFVSLATPLSTLTGHDALLPT